MAQIKNLSKVNLEKLQSLEKELGYCVVALETQPRLADISEAQLQRLQSLEKEMDAVLLAYACSPAVSVASRA